jgi:cysteine desulfurase
MKINLDNAATTPIDKEVLEEMLPYLKEKYGNASSVHEWGRQAREAIDSSRKTIAKSINVKEDEIIFTSGGTESNNFAIKSIAFTNKDKGKHIITTKIEHDCVLNSCKWLESQGFEVTYLDVDEEGFINLEDLKNKIRNNTILVSIIHGNNEIGTIQDLEAIGNICKEKNVYFHTDACQSFTKVKIDVKKINIDLITLNAHKIYGPKGVGALYIKKGTNIKAWQHGGGHEFDLRSGTENVPAIVGLAKAVQIAKGQDIEKMTKLRDKLIEGIEKIPNVILNGPKGDKRLGNNVNFSFLGIEGESIGTLLMGKGIASSTGSACSSHKLEPSHVIMALRGKASEAHGSIRFTLSKFNTEEEIDYVLEVLPDIIKKLRRISPFEKVVDVLLGGKKK